MGHSDVGVTLNVYTHASFDRVAEQMAKIIDFKETNMQGKKRKSGWKYTNLLHHLLHHLPMNLRRIIKNCVCSGQNTKLKKNAKKPKISRFVGLWKDIIKMIKILFICHGKTLTRFCNALKIKAVSWLHNHFTTNLPLLIKTQTRTVISIACQSLYRRHSQSGDLQAVVY